eukprot:2981036-Prymnesium_polylepis.1
MTENAQKTCGCGRGGVWCSARYVRRVWEGERERAGARSRAQLVGKLAGDGGAAQRLARAGQPLCRKGAATWRRVGRALRRRRPIAVVLLLQEARDARHVHAERGEHVDDRVEIELPQPHDLGVALGAHGRVGLRAEEEGLLAEARVLGE